MSKMKIAVTGAGGQLGKELARLAPHYPQYDFIFLTRTELPLDQEARLKDFFEEYRPEICINCAAYTAVDKAETEKETALAINGKAPGIIAAALAAYKGSLIHISTDYVFNGNDSNPLNEEYPTDPVNYYGLSKLTGEQNAVHNNPSTIVIRTSWLYSVFGHNFVKTMKRLMKEKESISVVDDQIGSPTHAGDLAKLILQIILSGHFTPGIYHYSNEGRASWHAFALKIKELTGSACLVNPVPGSAYPTAAKRPRYSLLDKSKIKKVYNISIPDWEQSLAECLNDLKE